MPRIAFLGAGYINQVHARHLSALPGVEIVGVCSTRTETARAFSDKFSAGRAGAFTDFTTMLDSGPVDALVVALPPGAHSGQVEAAASRGIHLLLEKPLALDPVHAASQVRAIEAAGVVAMVGYHLRSAPTVRRLHQLIRSGAAGRPTLFVGQWACNSLHSAWWRDIRLGGGQVLEQAIHIYDLALHLFGPVGTASGLAGNLVHRHVPDYTVDDTSAALLRFASGAFGTITASNAAIPGRWEPTWSVVCEKLTARFESPSRATFTFTGETEPRTEVVEDATDMYAAQAAHFLAALRREAPPLATARDGWLGVALTSAVLASAATGGQPRTVAPF